MAKFSLHIIMQLIFGGKVRWVIEHEFAGLIDSGFEFQKISNRNHGFSQQLSKNECRLTGMTARFCTGPGEQKQNENQFKSMNEKSKRNRFLL